PAFSNHSNAPPRRRLSAAWGRAVSGSTLQEILNGESEGYLGNTCRVENPNAQWMSGTKSRKAATHTAGSLLKGLLILVLKFPDTKNRRGS
ncbi:hypothetical protein, partial [Pseudomonas savastanoi]